MRTISLLYLLRCTAFLLLAAIAYYLLQQVIIREQGPDSMLKKAIGRDWKSKVSLALYPASAAATAAFDD